MRPVAQVSVMVILINTFGCSLAVEKQNTTTHNGPTQLSTLSLEDYETLANLVELGYI